MKTKKTIALTALLAAALHGTAQQTHQPDSVLNAVVEVENQYNPTVVEAEKILRLPTQEQPTGAYTRNVQFAQDVRLYTGYPGEKNLAGLLPLQPAQPSGYLRAAGGNYGLLDGKYYQRIKLAPRQELRLSLLFDGWNGKLKADNGISDKWDSRYYRTGLQTAYKLLASRDYEVQANLHLTNLAYNYKKSASLPMETDKQHDLLGGLSVGLAPAATHSRRFSLAASTAFDVYSQARFMQKDAANEQRWNLQATAAYNLDGKSAVELSAESDVMLYATDLIKRYDYYDYWSMQLNPAYTYAGADGLLLRVGVHADFISDVDKSARLAPDVMLKMNVTPSFELSAHARGGRQMLSFSDLSQLSPYWAAPVQQLPAYTLFDFAAGCAIAPVDGLRVNFEGGYKWVDNNTFGVHSMELAQYSSQLGWQNVMSLFPGYCYTANYQARAKVAYLNAAAKYHYRNLLELHLDASLMHTSTNAGSDVVLRDVPVCDINVGVQGRLFNCLYAYAGYRFVRLNDTESGRDESVNDLSLKLTFDIVKRLNLYVTADNLLNRNYEWFTGYASPGVNFMGGASFTF